MRFALITICFLASFLSSLSQAADAKPFRNVYVVDSGSTYDTAVILGVLNGLESEMNEEDLLVATNASSLAAAIFLNFPTPAERLNYLGSREYHQFLLKFDVNPGSKEAIISAGLAMKLRNYARANPSLPGLIGHAGLQSLPEPFELPNFEKGKWSSPKGKPSLMVLATRVNFDPSATGDRFMWMQQNGKALFTLIGFSDVSAMKKISDAKVQANTLAQYGEGKASLADKLELAEISSINSVIKKAISNPPLFAAVKEGGDLFVGSASNHDPVDLALSLSREKTVATYSGAMSGDEADVIKDIYNYDINNYRGRYQSYAQLRQVKLETFFRGEPYRQADMSLKFSLEKGLEETVPEALTNEQKSGYQDRVKWLAGQGESLAK